MQGNNMTIMTNERPGDTMWEEQQQHEQGSVPVSLPELDFVYPLPGFEGLKRFVLVRFGEDGESDGAQVPQPRQGWSENPPVPDADAVLFELRSLEIPEIKFVVGVPGVFFPGYRVDLDNATCIDLGLEDSKDALTFVILSMGTDTSAPHANLLAPIVVNRKNRKAAQIILNDTGWSIRAAVEQVEGGN